MTRESFHDLHQTSLTSVRFDVGAVTELECANGEVVLLVILIPIFSNFQRNVLARLVDRSHI